jgi:hypothetical protein
MLILKYANLLDYLGFEPEMYDNLLLDGNFYMITRIYGDDVELTPMIAE